MCWLIRIILNERRLIFQKANVTVRDIFFLSLTKINPENNQQYFEFETVNDRKMQNMSYCILHFADVLCASDCGGRCEGWPFTGGRHGF